MTMKEQPLINAMKRSGPWPSYFFTNPYVCGIMPVLLCAVLTSVSVVIYASAHGATASGRTFFAVARGGAVAGTIFAIICAIAVTVGAYYRGDEEAYYNRFLVGALLTAGLLFLANIIFWPFIEAWANTLGPLQ